MKHVCYHILSDLHNRFFNTIEEVQESTKIWQTEGDDHFKIYKICTEDCECEEDAIILDEELISLDMIRRN